MPDQLMNHTVRRKTIFYTGLGALLLFGLTSCTQLGDTSAPAEPELVTSALPPGARGPENNVGTPVAPKRTANVRGPTPTNDWWSSLVFQALPG